MAVHAMTLTVQEKDHVADGVAVFKLGFAHGGRLPDWAPGAHVAVDVPGGSRCYSLCGDRWDASTYTIAVRRDPVGRGGSIFLHDEVRRGDTLVTGVPRNNFPMVPSAHYTFIAGGIGITPLLPMVAQAMVVGATWQLHYGGRSRASLLPLERFLPSEAAPNVSVYPADEDKRMDLGDIVARTTPATVVYACGPLRLLAAVEDLGDARRQPPRIERFARADEDAAPIRPFCAQLATGQRLHVGVDQSLRDVLIAHGLDVPGACLQGICGACEVPVQRGVVAHRDLILSPQQRAANQLMYSCVSRAANTDIVLGVGL